MITELIHHARTPHPPKRVETAHAPRGGATHRGRRGVVGHPDARSESLEVSKFDYCEIGTGDLVAVFVLAVRSTNTASPQNEAAPSYWLDLHTGSVAEWTDSSLVELRDASGAS